MPALYITPDGVIRPPPTSHTANSCISANYTATSRMVGDRRVPRTQHDVWAYDRQFTRAAIARPDGAVDVFDITSSTARIAERIPSTPQLRGVPTSLVVQPGAGTSAKSPDLFVASASKGGQIFIRDRVVSRLESCVSSLQLADVCVFACDSASKNVVMLDAQSGNTLKTHSVSAEHVGNLSALAVSSNATSFAVCSQHISVHDAQSGKTLKTFAGHQSPISTAHYFSNDTHVVTGSKDDAHVFIWDLSDVVDTTSDDPSKKRRKRRRMSTAQHAAHTLMAPEQGIRQISVSQHGDGVFSFAALLKSGVVAVWRNWKSDTKQRMSQPDCVVYPCEEESVDGAPTVHCVGFHSNDSLKIVYGPNLRPQLHSISLDTIKMKMYLPKPAQDNLLVNHSKALRDGQIVGIESGTLAAARAEAEASEAVATAPLNMEGPTRRRKRGASVKADSENDDTNARSDEEETQDEPLAKRLEALGVSGKAASVVRLKEDEDELDALQGALAEDATSKVTVLLQALRSDDDKLLELVLLRKQKESVITTTVRKLPGAIATDRLLAVIETMLRNNPNTSVYLVPWLKEIITEHANSLNWSKNQSLNAVAHHVKSRLELAAPLMRLHGRLELVARRAQRARVLKENSLAFAKPKLELVETIGDANDEQAQSSSEEDAESDTEEEEEDGSAESESESGEAVSKTVKTKVANGDSYGQADTERLANGRMDVDSE